MERRPCRRGDRINVKRLRGFLSEHRAAAAIVAIALVAFAVWKVYTALSPRGPAATPSAIRPAASPAPGAPPARDGGAPGGGPTGDAALRAAGHLAGVAAPTLPGAQLSTGGAPAGSPSTGATAAGGQAPVGRVATPAAPATAPAASTPPPPGTGRPDPFSPLAASGGSRPASTNPPLPPVPPLSPGALGPSGFTAPGSPLPGAPDLSGPRGQFHLTGIVRGSVAVAILNDGAASYIVEPGDTVTPGVRVVAIDAGNHSVTLASKDQSWQLRLEGGTSR